MSLEVHPGEVVGLLGPNGAGKTTTFYMIVGLIKHSRGRILLDGEEITHKPMYKRARILFENPTDKPCRFLGYKLFWGMSSKAITLDGVTIPPRESRDRWIKINPNDGDLSTLSEAAAVKELPPVPAGGGARVIARLTFDVKANAPGGVYPLRLVDGIGEPAQFNRFTNAGHSVRPELIDGQFVSVFLEGSEPVLTITLPRAAVLQDQQGAYVFVVGDGNVAQRRNVRLGRSTGEVAVIESGLEGGESVVVEGVQRVRPGQPVNPGPAAAPPAPQTTPARG